MGAKKSTTPAFLAGGGELGERIRTQDWSNTNLGSPEQWPQSLQSTLGICLNMPSPILICWGDDLIMLYNDAYRLILGEKHPQALGSKAQAVWPELWATLGPTLNAICTGGQTKGSTNQRLMINRDGVLQTAYFSFSHSPIYNETGGIGGVFCLVTETTDTKLAERQKGELIWAGREHERNLATLFEQASVGIAIIGPAPNFILEMANPFYCDLVGRLSDCLIGKPLLDAMPELGEQGIQEVVMQVLKSGVPYVNREMPVVLIRSGQQETIYVDKIYQPRRTTDQSTGIETITGVVVILTDITTMVRARQQIETNERVLDAMFRQTPLGVGIWYGPDYIIERANPVLCQLWNHTPDELLGKPLFVASPESKGQGFEAMLNTVRQTGVAVTGTDQPALLYRNGQLKTVYFDFVYEPLRSPGGDVDRIMVVATEVTKAREERQLMAENATRLQTLFERAPVAIAILGEGPDFRFELANLLFCAITSRTGDQLIGKPLLEAVPELAGQGFETLLEGVCRTKQTYEGREVPTQLLRNSQLSTSYFDFVYEPLINAKGNLDRILVVCTDVTERVIARQKTEQLLIRERQLNELKSNFITLASHEFRTPMGLILSSASLIGRYNGPDDGEKRERHVQHIKLAVQSLTGLLTNFLSLSQLEQSSQRTNPHPMNIITFCQEVVDHMRSMIKPDQRIIYSHQSGAPTMSLDGQLLKQVLINLLSNASKYSSDNKQIELTTSVKDNQLSLAVKDEGIGIPDADKDKLFINFFRARNVNHVDGIGLGLYAVKRCVDLLGGRITFSKLDVGTVFTVQLPLSPPLP
ncbi:PAS domain-containing protein [Spirosoma sp. HMF4905]|uniref:histidine kinase n=1 Tax=Spirosoma arboris TaxID=2682092 RepID=A0A7K1SR58_9BACT|nr:PAS domain-containing protein [Spirosoma arboris]MVM36183.1 PAS domain-containing protein [Spirosoma arboris]